VPRLVCGEHLLGVINSGLDQLNVSACYQQIIKGVIIVGAVWLDRRARRED
jgi:ribose/xylose/arabinose/galactoside ABC-type transport system permease subunit